MNSEALQQQQGVRDRTPFISIPSISYPQSNPLGAGIQGIPQVSNNSDRSRREQIPPISELGRQLGGLDRISIPSLTTYVEHYRK